jgi:hypothetical protein
VSPVLAAVLVTAVPAAAGGLAVRAPWLLRIALGGLLGTAAAGLGATVGAFAGAPLMGAIAGLGVLAGVGYRRPLIVRPTGMGTKLGWVLVVVGVALAGVTLIAPPVLGWDAWAIWSLRAKMLAAYGSHVHPLAAPGVAAHPDYPPFLSAVHALHYILHGQWDTHWPAQFQLAWMWALASVAIVGLVSRRGTPATVIAFAALSAPTFLLQLLGGLADVPLALLLASGAVLLVQREYGYGALLLAAAALTKNEGMVFAAIVSLCAITSLRDVRSWVPPAAVALASTPWILFTRLRGMSNDFANTSTLDLSRIGEMMERLPDTLASVSVAAADPRAWAALPLILAGFFALRRVHLGIGLAALLSMLAVTITYLVSPTDLEQHLTSSVARTVIGPIVLAAVAVALGAPHERGADSDLMKRGTPEVKVFVGGRRAPATPELVENRERLSTATSNRLLRHRGTPTALARYTSPTGRTHASRRLEPRVPRIRDRGPIRALLVGLTVDAVVLEGAACC